MKKIRILLLFIFIVLFFNINSVFGATTFTSNIPNTTDTKTYSIPDLSTLPSQYYSLLENGYILINNGSNTWSIAILKTSDSYFYIKYSSIGALASSPSSHLLTISDITKTPSWASASYLSTDGSFNDVKYYGADIYTDANKTTLFYEREEEMEEEYIFPYIANTDEDLLQVEDTGYLLIMPRFCNKYKSYKFYYNKSIR